MTPLSQRQPPEESYVRGLLERQQYDTALEWLMSQYGDRIYSYCLRMLTQPELAEDTLQVTFVSAHRSLSTFRGESTLLTWLLGIARHRCLDAGRQVQRSRERYQALEEQGADQGESLGAAQSAEAESILSSVLQFCLSQLNPELRDLVLLRFNAGLGYEEIEEALGGLNAAALRARISRVLPKLRTCLVEQGVFQ